jgi:SAM-dependent methyltransferase
VPRLPNDLPPRCAGDDATAAFYDAAAAGYDAQVDGQPDNARVRQLFCERVSSLAGTGGSILDFGCGTGADAAWYAAHGHRVVAYDLSPRMAELLRTRCASEIASGRVMPAAGRLEAMTRALEASGPVSAVAANFAVLNHVCDLRPLLHVLASHLVPRGALVASVLNPFHRADMRRAWWWRSLMRSGWAGALRMDGEVTTWRHFVGTIRRAAAPDFVVEDVRAPGGQRPGFEALDANFLFLVLRRRP